MYKSKWVSVLSLLWVVGCGGGGGDGEENGAPKVSIPEVYTDYAITLSMVIWLAQRLG
ncbi:hypothetical protein [Vibrio variabilis]|uniref:hypothetical protein n=1 Tax=Vibrio variabilis TaxID=990271 RepID=UPI0013A6F62A|nr:hypothetical protein [Vibrio variabilis]